MAGNFSGVKIIGAIPENHFFIYLLKLRIIIQFEFAIHIYDKKDNFHYYSKNALLEKKFSTWRINTFSHKRAKIFRKHLQTFHTNLNSSNFNNHWLNDNKYAILLLKLGSLLQQTVFEQLFRINPFDAMLDFMVAECCYHEICLMPPSSYKSNPNFNIF